MNSIFKTILRKAIGPLIGDMTIWKSIRQVLGTQGMTVKQPYKQSVWVYACITKIIENMQRVPFVLKKDAGTLEPDKIESGQLYDLFQNPNPMMSQEELIRSTMGFFCLRGEAFWILDGREDITKIPDHIWTFDPARFEPVADKKTGWLLGWKYKGLGDIYFSVNEIIHFKTFNPYDDYRGLAPYEAARLSTEQNYQASIYNKSFFENGANIGGFISVPDELTDESFERLVKQFEDRHKGADKAHKIAVVEQGGKFIPAKMSQKEMDFVEGKNVTKEEILAAYGVNKVVLGDFSDIKCFHPDTEVFTEDGFKSVTEIKVGDKIATLNPATGKAEFKPATNVYAYDYNGIMYKQTGKNQKIAYCVTPEHKMFGRVNTGTRKEQKGKLNFVPIKDIKEKKFSVPRNSKWDCGDRPAIYDIGKRAFERKDYHNGSKNGLKETEFPIKQWLKFLGWFISEGNYFPSGGRYEIGITQTKPEGRKQFKNDMRGFPYVITEYERMFKLGGKDLYTYLMDNVGHYCYEKKIPSDIKKLHPTLLLHLFTALMAGDGHCFNEDRVRYSTTSYQLAEDVFEIAIKLGYTPTISGGRPGFYKDKEGNRKECKPVWHVEMSKHSATLEGWIRDVEKIHYKGKVHCFEVPPYHTVLTRYDGKIMWIGQSYEGIKSAHKAFWEECLMPKILYFENTLWNKFFSKIGQRRGKGRIWGTFDIANVGPLQVNYKEKVETAKTMFFMGWPINDINKRLELGMKEVPWGNEWWVPGGYLPVTVLLNGKPKKEPKTPEDDNDTVEENIDHSTLIERFYCEPIIEDFKSKFSKFLFEVRKRAIAASFGQKKWDDVLQIKDITKLKQSLDSVYLVGVNSGMSAVQSKTGSLEIKVPLSLLNEYKETRTTNITRNFERVVSTLINRLSTENVSDEKIREVFNLLTSKCNEIAKKETYECFKFGKDAVLQHTKKEFSTLLIGGDDVRE